MLKKQKFIKKSNFLDSLTLLEKKSSFLDSLINFIKYHNAFVIGFMIVFVGFSTALAVSPELREDIVDVLVSKEQAVQSIDNKYILSADLDNFNFNLQVKEITEDQRNYYVIYAYKTIDVQDYVWQELEKEKTMTVSKQALGNKDLGIYIAEELGEIIDYTLSYLKEVQTIETEKGLTQKIVTTQYAGLIGVFLNPKEKVFPGYEPVVQAPEQVDSAGSPQEPIAYDSEIIQEFMTDSTGSPQAEELIDEPVLEQTEIIDFSPDTIIDTFNEFSVNTHPQNTTTSTEAIFTFHSYEQVDSIGDKLSLSQEEDSVFQCKVNLGEWQNCVSPKTYSGLVPGDYTFRVFSTDSQGNYDATPSLFSWIIIESIDEDVIVATTTDAIITTTTDIIITTTTTDIIITTTTDTTTATSTDLTNSPQADSTNSPQADSTILPQDETATSTDSIILPQVDQTVTSTNEIATSTDETQ